MHLTAALRSFRRRRAVTGLIILTLTLGIGVVVAIFMIAQSILLKPLPYANADSVAMIWRKPLNRSSVMSGFRDASDLDRQIATSGLVQQWRGQKTVIADVAAIELTTQADLILASGAERIRGAFATPNLFEVLGVAPALGRLFNRDDTGAIVISDGFWRRAFGGDAAIVGRTMDLTLGRPRARQTFVIAGVLPPAFRFTYPDETEFWIVTRWDEVARSNPNALRYQVVARLETGVTAERATAELSALLAAEQASRNVPATRRETVWVEPINDYTVGRVRPAIQLLAALCASVLLIGCVSAANLMLAQTASRERELVTQRFLGASRSRLLWQLLSETTVLVGVSTLLALVTVAALQPIIRAAVPLATPRANEIAVGFMVVVGASFVGGAVVLLAGLLPAWMSVRRELHAGMLQPHTVTTSQSGTRLRQLLIAIQIAFVTPLGLAAGLLLHSFWNLQHVELGFDSSNIVVAEMRLLNPRYRDAELRLFEVSVLERAKGIGGVIDASITSAIPMRGVDWLRGIPVSGADWVNGKPTLETTRLAANERQVEPNYFSVMQVAPVEGRLFDATDSKTSAPVAVVSESLARALFAGKSAVGQMLPTVPAARQIIGVVRDVRSRRVDEAGMPAFYTPRAQSSSELVVLVLKTDGRTELVQSAIRPMIAAIDPDQPVQNITTLDQVVSDTIDTPKVYATVAMTLALITLVLTLAGVCGVLFQIVSERTRELGIRAAVGAAPRQLIAAVMHKGVMPLITGVVVGTVASTWIARAMRAYLFEIDALPLTAYGVTAVVVLLCGLVACYLPGRSAAKLDTLAALRHE